jgi:Uncharacterised nucleotidyltransferase
MAPPSNESLSPEKRLLVCCARTKVPASIAEEIRHLVCSPLDWDLLFREAANHSLTPVLCHQLSAIASDPLDPARLQQLDDISRTFAIRNLALAAELFTTLNQLQSADAQAIPYKGPVLAVQAYSDIALREFEDLDIILRQRDIPKANEVMIGLGYRPKFPWILSANASASFAPGEYAYRNDARHMMVELHTERTLRHFPLSADIDGLTSRLVAISIAGQHLQTFSAEDTLLLLCIHGSKHFWQQLSWIADIAEFVLSHPRIDWDQVSSRARAMRANRMLAVSLLIALRLFEPLLPPDVLARLRSDSEANAIAEQIEHRLLSATPTEPSAVGRFHLRRHMLEGWLEGWRYSMRLATLPSDDDWSAMRLPAFLAPLHAAFRPFRLLRKYRPSPATPSHGSIATKKASN